MLQQIFDLLTTATGNLAYHLVLAFSILSALQMAIPFLSTKPGSDTRNRRMFFGLACLLALQLGQYIFSGLAWQGMLDGAFWLPPVDRGVMLLSLVLVIWLWLLPEKETSADAATGVLVILILVGLVYSVFWWRDQYPNLAYNSSWADFIIQLSAIFLLVSACLLLFFRKPAGWQLGLIMLGILALGPVLHLVIPLKGGAYSGAVRASQLAAFPMLFLLSHRWQEQKNSANELAQLPQETRLDADAPARYVNAETWQMLADMAQGSDTPASVQQILSSLAGAAGAQICLLAVASAKEEKITLQPGYAQPVAGKLDPPGIDARVLPLISNALQNGAVERLAVNTYSPDTLALGKAFGLEPVEDILFVPLRTAEKQAKTGLLLLFSRSLTNLSARQYSALEDLAIIVAHFLQHNAEMRKLAPVPDAMPRSAPTDDLRVALEEIVSLRALLADSDQQIVALRNSTSAQPRPRVSNAIETLLQDLHQPVTSIANTAETLIDDFSASQDDFKRKRLERIRVSTDRLSYLINELSQMVKSGNKSGDGAVSEFNINFLITRILEEAKKDSLARAISVSLDLPLQPLRIQSIYQQLESILSLLIHNAIMVSPVSSTIQVSAGLEHTEGRPDYVLIQVADRSGGIDLEAFSHGFVRPQAEEQPLIDGKNTGVDYAYVNVLVDTLGGRVWVDNEPGTGAVFSLLIPVKLPEATGSLVEGGGHVG